MTYISPLSVALPQIYLQTKFEDPISYLETELNPISEIHVVALYAMLFLVDIPQMNLCLRTLSLVVRLKLS